MNLDAIATGSGQAGSPSATSPSIRTRTNVLHCATRPLVTTLRAERGPGVELLQYLAPTDGHPYPGDARPNDLVHWQTTLLAPALDDAASAARAGGATPVSRDTAVLAGSRLGLTRAVLVRDPDGHALLLAEPRPVVARPGRR